MSETYQDLMMWRLALELGVEVYRCTADFPQHEVYGLQHSAEAISSFDCKRYRRG
jgi:hypothetical protein